METNVGHLRVAMRRILVPLVLFLSSPSWGFINIESIRLQTDGDLVGKTSLLFSGQSGNTEKATISASTSNLRRWARDEFLFLADYAYSYSQDVRDTNNGRLHLRYTLSSREPRSYELFSQAQFDEFQNLNLRTLFGANVRHRLVGTDEKSFLLGTGVFYEMESYTSDTYQSGFRGNIYLSYVEKLSDSVAGSLVAYYQPAIKRWADYRVQLMAGLETKLNARLTLDLNFELSHDSEPPTDRVSNTDMKYLAGFSLTY